MVLFGIIPVTRPAKDYLFDIYSYRDHWQLGRAIIFDQVTYNEIISSMEKEGFEENQDFLVE